MKIIISPANLDYKIEIHGDKSELDNVMSSLLSLGKLSSTSTPQVSKPATKPSLVTPKSSKDEIPKAKEFVASLFKFQPNFHTPHGRGRYIAELLATGNTFTKNQLAIRSKSTKITVGKTIAKMAKAGAEFVHDGDKIQLVAVPIKDYSPARRSDLNKSRTVKASETKTVRNFNDRSQTNQAVLATLSGRKLY